jgi:hypothetical protein
LGLATRYAGWCFTGLGSNEEASLRGGVAAEAIQFFAAFLDCFRLALLGVAMTEGPTDLLDL